MKIDDQLYSFLTHPDNFDPFIDLQNQFKSVRDRLIDEFWVLVYNYIQTQKSNVPEWDFYMDEKGIEFRKIGAIHKDAINTKSQSKIVYEFLDKDVILGIWIHYRDMGALKIKEIRDEAISFVKDKHPWQPATGQLWYTILKRPGLNLLEKSSLLEILPSRRNDLVKQYGDDFIMAIKELGHFCIDQAKKN